MGPKSPKDGKKPEQDDPEESGEIVALDDRCGLCALFGSSSTHLLTERELKALDTMRGIREEASRIKQRLRGLENDPESGPYHRRQSGLEDLEYVEALWEQGMAEELLNECDKLYRLRKQWEEWDQERMAAAEERMRLLGHVQ